MRRCFAVLAVILVAAPLAPISGQATDRYPCRNVHTFDFWVGTFEARPTFRRRLERRPSQVRRVFAGLAG